MWMMMLVFVNIVNGGFGKLTVIIFEFGWKMFVLVDVLSGGGGVWVEVCDVEEDSEGDGDRDVDGCGDGDCEADSVTLGVGEAGVGGSVGVFEFA